MHLSVCWPLYGRIKECHWRVRYLTRLGSGLYGGGGLQWEADTIAWLLWPPFISPLACMWWLLSMFEPVRKGGEINKIKITKNWQWQKHLFFWHWYNLIRNILNKIVENRVHLIWFETLTHMGYGGRGSGVLLGLLPHQLVDWGRFAKASVGMKLVHVRQCRIRGWGCYMASKEKRRRWLRLEECVCWC